MTEAAVSAIDIEQLRVATAGAWTTSTDPRGVLTMRHPYQPSVQGSCAEAQAPLPATPPATSAQRFLRFYLSDGYAGHETGNPELGYPPEWFPQARFVSVHVGDRELLRQDVLGENPPVAGRFYQIEIPADAAGNIVLRVDDVRAVPADFATEVYWGLLGVVTVDAGRTPPAFGRDHALSPVLSGPATAAAERTRPAWPTLAVANDAEVEREEIVTSGIPFPAGQLTAGQPVVVRDGAGSDLPAQQRPLAHWPDGSVKCLLVDAPVHVGAGGNCLLHLASDGGSAEAAAADPHLAITRAGERVTIDTGAAAFTLGRTAQIVERVEVGGTGEGDRVSIVPTAPLVQLLNHDGFPSRFAGILAPDTLEIIEQGPLRIRLRAVGACPDVDSASGLRYEIRLDLCAGSPDIRVQHTVTNTTPGSARLRALSLRLAWPEVESFALDGWDGGLDGGEAWLVQHTHEHGYRWRYNAAATGFEGEITRTRGYALATSPAATVGLSLRDMWQQHPNGFRVDAEGLQVDLWTSDRVPWVLGSDPPLELAEGEAKTHDVLLAFGPAGACAEVDARLAAFQAPLFAAATPAWYCASGVFGPVAVQDAARFPEYEAAVAAMDPGAMGHGRGGPWETLVRHTHEERDTYQRYGFRHFGDNPLIWGYQTKYRMWANCEYDVAHCAFTQFARSGDRRYLSRGGQAALHNRDTDVVHASREHPDWVGAPHGHWIDHTVRGPNLGHLWTEGLVEHYLLTGDERSLAVAGGIADYCVRFVEGGWQGSGERTAGWPMIALLGAWHGSGEPRYLDAARRLKEEVVERQDDLRGVWTYKVYEQPAYEGGTVFMVDILTRALMRFHLATGDPAAAAAIVRAASWLRWEAVTETPAAPLAFYKQTPLCSRAGACDPETFAYAWALTGDALYHDLALRAYRTAATGWRGGVPTAKMRDHCCPR